MFNALRTKFSAIAIRQDNVRITIQGINVKLLLADIGDTWGTSVLATYMFDAVRTHSVGVPHFFAPDFMYMLNTLMSTDRIRSPKRVIKKLILELERNTWLGDIGATRKASITDLNAVRGMFPFSNKDYQDKYIEHYGLTVPTFNLKGYLLDAGAGTGKTATGLMLGKALGANKVIVISPLPAVDRVWRHTIEDLMLEDHTAWVSNGKGQELTKDFKYYIVHYEALGNFTQFVKSNLTAFENSYVILDESHNFNDPDSQRTAALVELCKLKQVRNINFASATPIMALGYECIPFLKCVDPLFNDGIEVRFKKIYGRNAKRANDILRNRIGHLKYHVPKQDVVDIEIVQEELKIKVPNGQEFTLPAVKDKMEKFIKSRRDYYQANKGRYEHDYWETLKYFEKKNPRLAALPDHDKYHKYIKIISAGFDRVTMSEMSMFCNKYEARVIIPTLPNEMKKPFRSAKSVVKYLDLKIMGEALGNVVGRTRSACNRAIVDNLDLAYLVDKAEKKTLFFTDHVDVLERAVERLKELGYTPAVVYGETNKELATTIKKFYSDPDLNPLVATLKSLSTAVPITCANHVVFLNEPFREAIREQAQSRAARLGQDTRVIVTGVQLDTGDIPNMSTRSKEIMDWSGEQVRSIMGVDNLDLETLSLESADIAEFTDVEPRPEDSLVDYLPQSLLPTTVYRFEHRDRTPYLGYLTCSDDLVYEKYKALSCGLPDGVRAMFDPVTRKVTISDTTGQFNVRDLYDKPYQIGMGYPEEDQEFRYLDSSITEVTEYALNVLCETKQLVYKGIDLVRELDVHVV